MQKHLLASILTTLSLSAAANPVSGIDYDVLLSPGHGGGSKVLVQEFFSYNCAPCLKQSNAILPSLERWKGKVEHQRVPLKGLVNPGYSAKIYYALDKVDPKDKAHLDLLKVSAVTPETALTTKETNSILQKNQIPLSRFNGFFSSGQTSKSELEGYKLATKYQITGDSAIVVNGRYIINKDTSKFPVVLNYLIDKEYKRISK